ncbi:retroviral-like aspartic protease family protein, partial [Thermodesulfobacteriota bacterium]
GRTRARLLRIRAAIHGKRGRNGKALRDYTRAIKLNYDDTELRALCYSDRAIVYLNMARPDDAVSDLNHSLRLKPNNAYAYAARAYAYLRKDRVERAKRDAQRALSMNPDGETAKLARKVEKQLSVSFSGPDRVTVPIADDGHVYVQVRFSRKGKSHRFMLDTGASTTLIKKELLSRISREARVRRIGRGNVRIADGSIHKVTRYEISNAFLYNLPLGRIEVNTYEGAARHIPNLLGMKSLRNIAISIDNQKGQAEIHRKD